MSLLKNLASDASIANEKDVIAGGSRVLDSAIYKLRVALAYVTKASSGALGLVLGMKTEEGKELRQTLWMTSGTNKGGKNYYEKDGEKHYLPGYLLANSLCLLTVGKEISDLDTEQKVVNVYNPEAKAEVPTKVDMVMDLIGQEIYGGVIKQIVDKTKKNEAGVYEPTGETREENEIDKFFRERDKMTTAEIRAQAEEPAFFDAWSAKWTGQVRDKSKGAGKGGTAGAPAKASAGGMFGSPAAAAGGTKKPATSLFGG